MKTVFYLTKVLCVAALFATMGCGSSSHDVQENLVADTLFTPTGDAVLDSLLQLAATAPQDTALALLYYDIGYEYLYNDSQKAKEYYLKLSALSEKLEWNEGWYLFATGYTEILNWEGAMDSSIVIFEKALNMAKKEMNETWIAKISANIGNCYNHKKWFGTALLYYNEALTIFEKRADKVRLAHLHSLISTVYIDMDMQDDAILACEKSLNLLNDTPDAIVRAYALTNRAIAFANKLEYETAEVNILEAQRIYLLHNNEYFLNEIYCNLTNIALQKFELDKVEIYAHQILEIALKFEIAESYCIAYRALGYVEEYRENFNKAEEYAKEALETADEFDLPFEKAKCYQLLSEISTARHDFRNYKLYRIKAEEMERTFTYEKSLNYAREMEVKYETEKKEIKISALEKEKRLYTYLGVAGGIILLLALVSFVIRQRLAVHKRKLAEQKLKQMEQEKQIVAAQAALDGENAERSRLARDLHDGLGSMLSLVKINLPDMKSGAVLEAEDVTRFGTAINMLNDSINELRRVAHHLMPESLMRYGLKASLADFCHSTPSVKFHYFGGDQRLDSKLEILLYRAAHELINNALKHAEATQINVQLVQETSRVSLTVQDNGKGFDTTIKTEGMGLENIRNRVETYNGHISAWSETGKGTEISIELKIEN